MDAAGDHQISQVAETALPVDAGDPGRASIIGRRMDGVQEPCFQQQAYHCPVFCCFHGVFGDRENIQGSV